MNDKSMRKSYMLEVCVDSVESALAAVAGGAMRLELCQNLIIGGTTPTVSLYQEIRRHTDIPIHVLIRPRFGDFCYTEHELRMMEQDINTFRTLGAQGVVFGVLRPDGGLNVERMKGLRLAAGELSVTLHRAFDLCRDPFLVMEEACALGIDTILTSGQQDHCLMGIELLRGLHDKAAGRICIQAGAGVDAAAIATLWSQTGIRAYHMSGKVLMDSAMEYRREAVHMGLDSMSEYTIYRTDAQQIQKARAVLEELS